MLKFKYVFSAFCMLVAMTMATSAIAQNILSVSSGVEPRAREHGYTEAAGGITLRVESHDETIADLEGVLTIDYGIPVTNHGTTTNAIVVTGGGCFGDTNIGDAVIEGNTVSITLGTNVNNMNCGANDNLDVSGVLLAIADAPGLTGGVEASIAVSGDFRLQSGGSRVTVLNAIVDELVDAGVSTGPREANKVTLVRHTGMNEAGTVGTFKLHIDENAVDSFEGVELNLDFTGIPAGAEIMMDAWVYNKLDGDGDPNMPNTDARTMYVAADASVEPNIDVADPMGNSEVSMFPATVSSETSKSVVSMRLLNDDGNDFLFDNDADADNNVDLDDDGNLDLHVYVGGMTDPAKIDRVTIVGRFIVDSDGSRGPKPGVALPLVDLDVQVTVDVGPTGVLKPAGSRAPAIPRFFPDPSHSVTVIDVESSTTTLSLPYALATQGFDTGIAISNMNTVTEQAGAITFMLYQNGDEPIEYTTDADSPGRGLTSGVLAAGTTYAVLLTEILNAAGVEGGFSGYAMITTDFTEADGIAYISDWAAFSATATLEVVD